MANISAAREREQSVESGDERDELWNYRQAYTRRRPEWKIEKGGENSDRESLPARGNGRGFGVFPCCDEKYLVSSFGLAGRSVTADVGCSGRPRESGGVFAVKGSGYRGHWNQSHGDRCEYPSFSFSTLIRRSILCEFVW